MVYPLLITVAVSAIAGRILSANLVYEPNISRNENEPPDGRRLWPKSRPEPMPTFSSNDRSRWATIRALVDDGTYVIGRRDPSLASPKNKYGDTGIVFEDGWGSIDKVMRPETSEFYSSKPPLLPTLVAGEYWLLKHVFGWSIVSDRWLVIRTILFTVNALPFLLYLVLLTRLLERLGMTDWGRLFVFSAGCFGTFLTTFAITLNNHTIAACTALFAIYPALRIWESASKSIPSDDAPKETADAIEAITASPRHPVTFSCWPASSPPSPPVSSCRRHRSRCSCSCSCWCGRRAARCFTSLQQRQSQWLRSSSPTTWRSAG
jgi:hypothetical protein